METENIDKTIGIRVGIGDLRNISFNTMGDTYIRSQRTKAKYNPFCYNPPHAFLKITKHRQNRAIHSVALKEKMEIGS